MFDYVLYVIKFLTFVIGIGTYIFQWASLMYEIIEGEVKNKKEIIWKVIPFGFLILVVWKWQELSKKEFVYEAEVVNKEEVGVVNTEKKEERKCLKNI